MSQRESKLSRDIQRKLRVDGAFCFKVWGSEHMMVGLPDIIGCYNGYFFGFEVKNPDNRAGVSTAQTYVGSMIQKAGGVWAVLCTYDEAIGILRERCKASP